MFWGILLHGAQVGMALKVGADALAQGYIKEAF